MKLSYFLRNTFIIYFLVINFINAQVPTIEWQKALGGSSSDVLYSFELLPDGGYILAGGTSSNNGDVTGNHGAYDYWIVKINSLGIIEWQKTYGGTADEVASCIKKTNDGGYIISGSSISSNGNVTFNLGNYDYWIVKINSLGIIEWQKTYGGFGEDTANSLVQTNDGGYIIAGYTNSNSNDVSGNHGGFDYWVVKLTTNGVLEWQKTLGGSGDDRAYNIIQSNDGNYVVAGQTFSNNGDVSGNHGNADSWIVKINPLGNIIWQKTLGGTSYEEIRNFIQTNDNGYILAGGTSSNNGDVTGNNGAYDYWIVKINSLGIIEWQKSLGGTDSEIAYSVKQTSDNGYIIGGKSSSNNGDVSGNHGGNDYWIVKINNNGLLLWQKSMGGTLIESSSYNICQTLDGGYTIGAFVISNDGDVTGNHGAYDYWIVKLSPESLSINSSIENNDLIIYPNPTKDNITVKLDKFISSQEIIITDIQGKIIHKQKLEGLLTVINTSSFEKGIYFLNLTDGTQKTTKKFIVE